MRQPERGDRCQAACSTVEVRTGFLDGIWAAVATPFEANGALDPKGIERNAHTYGRTLGLDGIFCNGLMGEGWALSADERRLALEATLSGCVGHLRVGV